MKVFPTVIVTLGLIATLVPINARAQNFDVSRDTTKDQLEALAGEVGSALRFRQLGDPAPLGKGNVNVGIQFANTAFEDGIPRVVGRIGVSDRVDIGAFGGFNSSSNFGLVGVDTNVALLTQGHSRPVTVSLRPSITSVIGPSKVWIGNASIDLSVSRAFGALSPYAGVATSASVAIERSTDVDLDPATVEGSLAYAGLAYRYKALVVSGEVEKGTRVSYGFRIGTQF